MAKSSDSQSSAADLPLKLSVERPLFSPPSPASASAFAASNSSLTSSSSSSFSTSVTADASLLQRSSSPTRVNLRHSSPPPAKSVNLSVDSSLSQSQSVSIRDQAIRRRKKTSKNPEKTCMCSPTTHPGSFRCHHHRNQSNQSQNQPTSCSSIRLSLRRSAMTNSLVRIGTAEGDWVKRALSALVRPTLQQQRRRVDFKPRRSRLSIMSTAQESDEI